MEERICERDESGVKGRESVDGKSEVHLFLVYSQLKSQAFLYRSPLRSIIVRPTSWGSAPARRVHWRVFWTYGKTDPFSGAWIAVEADIAAIVTSRQKRCVLWSWSRVNVVAFA